MGHSSEASEQLGIAFTGQALNAQFLLGSRPTADPSSQILTSVAHITA
jgi:hypothetical protein